MMECVLVLRIVRALVRDRLRISTMSDSSDNQRKLIESSLAEENNQLMEERRQLISTNNSLVEENSRLIKSLGGLSFGAREDENESVDVQGSGDLLYTHKFSDEQSPKAFDECSLNINTN